MNRLSAIMDRRSIRKFEDRPVEHDKIEAVLRAAMQCPTGKNSQCWEFLVIEDPSDRLALSGMSPFGQCAKNAPVVILTMCSMERADPEVSVWVQDLAAASMTMLTQAELEGLGATWLGMYPFQERLDAVRAYFHLPEHLIPFSAIAMGYKLKEKPSEDRYDPAKVHWGGLTG